MATGRCMRATRSDAMETPGDTSYMSGGHQRRPTRAHRFGGGCLSHGFDGFFNQLALTQSSVPNSQ